MKIKKNVFILVVVIIVLIIVGIVLGKNLLSKSKNNNDNNQKTEIISEKDLSNFDDKINLFNDKLSMYYPFSNINDIDNNAKLVFAYQVLNKGENDIFLSKEFKDIFKDYFISEFTYSNESIKCLVDNEIIFNYDKKTSTYSYTGNHNHENNISTKYFYTGGNADLKTSLYILNTKVLYFNSSTNSYYSSYDKAVKDEDSIYTLNGSENTDEITENIYEKNNDSIPTTSFVFYKNKSNKYLLRSVYIA